MSKIDYQALREAAERAIPAMERLLMLPADDDLLSEQELKDYGVDIDALNAFKFLAGPEAVLALLDERERNQQYIKRRDQENEMMVDAMHAAIALTSVGIDLDDYDECVLRLHEWGALPDYCIALYVDFVHGIVSKNKLLDFGYINGAPVWTLRDELEAAEMRIAELESLTAPQLPQPAPVSVPEVVGWEDVPEEITEDDIALASAWAIGFNQCRAAMLQCSEPVQEWIPCSERMPDKLIPVMVMYEDGEMWSAMWNGNRWDDGTEYPDPHSVTHWREMPAAPKQEVNRG